MAQRQENEVPAQNVNRMNVYDFDNTILRGDTTWRFTLWCARRYGAVRRHLGRVLLRVPRFLAGKMTLTEGKSFLLGYFALVPDMDAEIARFWEANMPRVKNWYLAARRLDDVVVTASPECLVRPACERLGVACVGTRADRTTGVITGKTCSGVEKVRRFREAYPGAKIEAFYSDSLRDSPLAREANRAYLVKGETLSPWPEP